MTDTAWLASLKEGDMVAYGSRDMNIGRVKRLTPTLIIVQTQGNSESRFKRKDGYAIGSSTWDTTHLEELTEEIRHSIQRRKMLYHFKYAAKWEEFPMQVLQDVYRIVKKWEETQKP